jgi:lipopolysaccharide export system permease protein
MKKLDRYILAEFFPPLLLVVLGLSSVVLLIQVVDMLPRLRDWRATTSQIVFFHLFQFPFLVAQVLPVGVMLATLVALGNLARSSELAAMGAGGVSRWRIAQPLLGAALALSLLLFAAGETLVPAASARSRWIQKVQIEHRDVDFDLSFREHMAKSLSAGRQLYVRNYDALRGSMGRLAILQFDGDRLLRRIDAGRGEHVKAGVWRLQDGMDRLFDAEGRVRQAVPFLTLEEDLGSTPRDFMVDSDKKEQDLAQLSMSELLSIIRRLDATGGDNRKERAVLQVRISYPFSCFILALLGVSLPYLFPSGRRALAGAALGLVTALGCGMLYLVFIQVGLSLGKSGALPTVLGAWLGNLLFGMAGAYTLWRVNK